MRPIIGESLKPWPENPNATCNPSIPGNVPHEVHVGPEGAVVIDVFVPTRDDWREAERVGRREPRWPTS